MVAALDLRSSPARGVSSSLTPGTIEEIEEFLVVFCLAGETKDHGARAVPRASCC